MDEFSESVGRIVSSMGRAAKREERVSAFCIGRVLEAGGGRLRIACRGLQLGPSDMWLEAGLSYKWTVDDGRAQNLRAGDRVILLSADGQEYYLAAKVVRA
ncbi:MAG: hypothetical protein ACOX81_10205 [Candidatus Heteroscillospira sp.]|jgi:hypothetical protein